MQAKKEGNYYNESRNYRFMLVNPSETLESEILQIILQSIKDTRTATH